MRKYPGARKGWVHLRNTEATDWSFREEEGMQDKTWHRQGQKVPSFVNMLT